MSGFVFLAFVLTFGAMNAKPKPIYHLKNKRQRF